MRHLPHPFRFWDKVLIPRHRGGSAIEGACWLWVGAITSKGYGAYWLDGMSRQAHVVAYELMVGPVPEGLVLDHVRARGCRCRNCVNPHHLEPVTDQENVRRGASCNGVKDTCRNGHPWTEENTICTIHPRLGYPQRKCQTCREERAMRRAYRHRQRS
jgi:hypothetical protein